MPQNISKKIVFILLFVAGVNLTTKAQGNLPYADDRWVHFGFLLGFNSMDFGIKQSMQKDSITGNVYNAAVSSVQPGFSVGIISDLRLTRYLNLRCTPSLHFGSRTLTYTSDKNQTSETISLSSIPINIPIYLKYSAERVNNYRPYLIWGGGAGIDLSTDQTKPVLLKPLNFFTEFGVGCDIYFPFFKLCPELKFSLGLNDILTPLDQRNAGGIKDTDRKLTNSISKLTSKMLTLSFNFE